MTTTWRFRTPRFETIVWETPFMRVAEIWERPRADWPIAAAVDLYKRKSRQALVREALGRATDKIVRRVLKSLYNQSRGE